jgi:hypothetical protein
MSSHFVDEIMLIATRNIQVPKSLAREFLDFPIIALDFALDRYFHGLLTLTLAEFFVLASRQDGQLFCTPADTSQMPAIAKASG